MRILMVPRREDGAIAVMVALLAVVLLGIAAFTTDFGMAYAQRRALSTGADSAALAVIHTKYNTQLASPSLTCDKAISDDAALGPNKASNIALRQVNANAPFGATIPEEDVSTTLSCESGGTVLQVRVEVNATLSPILGGVLGSSPMHLNRQAVAALGVVNGVTNAMPIAVCTSQAQDIIKVEALHPGSAQLILLDKVWPTGASCPGTGGSGNWGWLDFGEGVSVQNLKDYISGTYKTKITIDNSTTPPSATMDGTPGNKANAKDVITEMQTFINKNIPAVLPVYSTVGAGKGSGTTYNVIGFLSVRLCGFQANTKQALATFSTTCYDSTTSGVQLTADSMQVQYVNYTPAGQMGEVCSIGSTFCASPNTYVTKLLR